MNHLTLDNLFKKTLNARESKAAQTTRSVQSMLADEQANREAKTARLKGLRLASEANRPSAVARQKPLRTAIKRQGKRG